MHTTRLGRFLVTGGPGQVELVRAALAACTFPVAEKLPRDIPVTFTDLSQEGALGLFWTDGRIELEQTLGARQAQAVFLAEAWHAIDQYLLTSGDRAALLVAAHGTGPDGHTWFDNASYYADLGEMVMDVFLAAYTPYPPTGLPWEHPVTARVVAALRGILTPTPPPEAPAPPPPFPLPQVRPWLDKAYSWTKAERAAKTAIRDWLR